jgi:hypothetical protein
MPGRKVSAKRLNRIWGNIDALRHNLTPLLRRGKEMGAVDGRPAIMKKWLR